MSRTLTMTAIAALLAGPAMADGVNYARLSYDYTQFDIDDANDTEFQIGLFQGAAEYEVGQFLLSADINNYTNDFDNLLDVDLTTYTFSAAYVLSPEVLLGAGLNGADIEFEDDEGSFDADANGYEVFAQYQTAAFGTGINVTSLDSEEDNVITTLYGELTAAPDVKLAAIVSTDSEDEDEGGSDGSRYHLAATYDQGPIFARAFLNGDTDDEDTTFGVRGAYDFTPEFFGTGAYSTSFGDDALEAYVLTVGAGYSFAEGVSAEANVGFVDGDDVNVDITRFQIGLTYELGQRRRLDNRLDQDLTDDIQSAGAGGFFGDLPILGFSF